MNRKHLYTYIGLAYVLAWIPAITCIYILKLPAGIQISGIIDMFTPALAVLLLYLIHRRKTGWKETLKPHLKHHLAYYAAAWFLPFVLTVLGALLYFIFFTDQLDLSMRYAGILLTQQNMDAAITPGRLVLLQTVQAVTYAPALNALIAAGEELGWRGFLYPELRKAYSPLKAHLITAFIWSFWHFPINFAGYNYGLAYPGFPWGGILAMFVSCFSMGILMSWVYEKTGSIWAPAVMHGAFNAIASLPLFFQNPQYINQAYTLLGPVPNGLLAGLPMLLLAVYILYRSGKEEQA